MTDGESYIMLPFRPYKQIYRQYNSIILEWLQINKIAKVSITVDKYSSKGFQIVAYLSCIHELR